MQLDAALVLLFVQVPTIITHPCHCPSGTQLVTRSAAKEGMAHMPVLHVHEPLFDTCLVASKPVALVHKTAAIDEGSAACRYSNALTGYTASEWLVHSTQAHVMTTPGCRGSQHECNGGVWRPYAAKLQV